MPDQSLLSPEQDLLMFRLSHAWDRAREDGLDDPDSLMRGLDAAHKALLEGGAWPDIAWVEDILIFGSHCGAGAVLNYGKFPECKAAINDLYAKVLELRWLNGSPSGRFEAIEAENLGRAVGQWQFQPGAMDGYEETPKKKRFGIF